MENIRVLGGIGHVTCNETIEELMRLVASQRELLQTVTESLKAANQTIATLNSLMALMPNSTTEKRGKGRPAKRVDDAWLVEKFDQTMLPEFVAANVHSKPTDTAVLNWYFTKEFVSYGLSASRVRGKLFQSKLKTLKNRLGNARNRLY